MADNFQEWGETGHEHYFVFIYDPDSDAGRAQVEQVARTIAWQSTNGCVDLDDPAESEEYRNHQRDLARDVLDALRGEQP